jgi:hypothetical protein
MSFSYIFLLYLFICLFSGLSSSLSSGLFSGLFLVVSFSGRLKRIKLRVETLIHNLTK